MNEKWQKYGPRAGLVRLVAPLAFVILTAVIYLLLFGSRLWAASDRNPLEQNTLTPTNTSTSTTTLGPGKRIQIPRIDKDEGWDTRIQVQNVGYAQTGVITLFWGGYSGQCQDIELVDHLCQLISDSWGILAIQAEIPDNAESAILYSVSSDLYQAACEAADSIDSHEAWRDWEDTYAYSGEPLAVTVDRLASNGSSASSMYNGFSENMLGSDPPWGLYFVPSIMHGYDNFDSTITIQNSGELCCSVWLYYKEEGNCEFMKAQHVELLAPGEAISIGAGADADRPFPSPELDAPWLGSAYITACAPLAIVVDQWDANSTMLLTYAGVPADYGGTANYAPLVYRDLDGWNAEIHVQNLTQKSQPTFVTAHFFDMSGNEVLSVSEWVCRNGMITFYLSDLAALGDLFPSGYIGAVEIQSDGEPIASVVSLIGSSDGLSYNAFSPQQVTGVTKFAIPLISKQSQGGASDIVKESNGATSRIVIRNNSNCNKFDGEITIKDETGASIATIAVPWLTPKHMKVFDLTYFGMVPDFVGAAAFEVLGVEQLCDVDDDGHLDDEPVMPSVVLLNLDPDGSASGQEAFPMPTSTPTPKPTATTTPTPTGTPTPTPTPTWTPTPTETPSIYYLYVPLIMKHYSPPP